MKKYQVSFMGSLPKEGESRDDNSDFALNKETRNGLLTVVADGATQGVMNKEWARYLAESFLNTDENSLTVDGLFSEGYTTKSINNARLRWKDERDKRVNDKKNQLFESEYTWLFKRGSNSTLLCVQVVDSHYKVIAYGDTCIFHIHKNRLNLAFPLTSSTAFNDTPSLISSIVLDLDNKSSTSPPTFRREEGTLGHGDYLLIMTDALSTWFLREVENGNKPWEIIKHLKMDSNDFNLFISDLREKTNTQNYERRNPKLLERIKEIAGNRRQKQRKSSHSSEFSSKVVNDDMTLVVISG
jgi:hypothetical protein